MVQIVTKLPEMQETWVQFLGQEDPLEKEKATQSSILAWRIPRWDTVHGILQARILEWVAFPFSRGSSQPKD